MPVVFVSTPVDGAEAGTGSDPPAEAPLPEVTSPAQVVLCAGCGSMSAPGPSCDRCGSPFPETGGFGVDDSVAAAGRARPAPPVISVRPYTESDGDAGGSVSTRRMSEGLPSDRTLDWERETPAERPDDDRVRPEVQTSTPGPDVQIVIPSARTPSDG